MTAPLDGIRVVELGQMVAVPAATQILASYGASVIKVEDTGPGDALRFYGSSKNGMSAWFVATNGGKRSIALDLKSDTGKEILWRLLEKADLFIEGFRSGVIEKLGFDYDTVKSRLPRIIYFSCSGFGAIGPYANQPVYDPLIQSLAGWAGIQQHGGVPNLVRGMVADKVGAYTNAQAMMAALIRQAHTGSGSFVRVNMHESNIAFNWPDVMMDCMLMDPDAEHRPNVLMSYRLYRCSDGWVSIAPAADRHWQNMCSALERPDIYADERFIDSAGRGANFQSWTEAIEAMVEPLMVKDVLDRLRQAEVPVAPVLLPNEVYDDPQVSATGMIQELQHPHVGGIRLPRPAASFFGDPLELRPAPSHGEHSVEILQETNYSAAEIKKMLSEGTIVGPRHGNRTE